MISIIMNCYNGEAFLSSALESVINQTYKNWELIFWDNVSKDNSASIFKSYNDKRFNYYLASKHDLLYCARKKAIKKAKGEFLAFLDVDDFWHSSKLEKEITLFTNKHVGAVYSNFWFLNQRNGKKKRFTNFNLPSGHIRNKLLENYQIGLLTLMVRRRAYEMYGFDGKYHIIGDFDLCIKISSDWKIEALNECLATYRWHGNNETSNHVLLQAKELRKWTKKNKSFLSRIHLDHLRDKILRIEFSYQLNECNFKKCFIKTKQMKLTINKIKSLFQIFSKFLLSKHKKK
jgi:glycosyltransferase involved in cell wall biosynthesis